MAAGNVQVTVTAKTGPGITVTGMVLNNVSAVNFRFADGIIDVVNTNPSGQVNSFQYSDIATVTISPSAKTVVIST